MKKISKLLKNELADCTRLMLISEYMIKTMKFHSNPKTLTMKNILSFVFLFMIPFISNSQETALMYDQTELSFFTNSSVSPSEFADEDLSKFALSLNPLGFIQFGPVINAEFGIKENIVLNTHVRFPSLGLLTYVLKYHDDGLDELSGIAFGGGLIYFFGDNMSKPYVGGMLEYHRTNSLYAKAEGWEWSQIDQSGVFIFNGGYRWRFEGGFFVNTGVFFGAAMGNYDWEYADPSYDPYEPGGEGTDVTPFGMFEVTLGLEF
jgi:hypothetical protein